MSHETGTRRSNEAQPEGAAGRSTGGEAEGGAAVLDPASSADAGPEADGPKRGGWFARLRAVVVFLWKYTVGATLCMTLLGSVLVVGWVQRWMRRTALKRWHRRSGIAIGWTEFALADANTAEHHRAPNWLIAQDVGEALRRGTRRQRLAAPVRSLGANLKHGAAAVFNVWVLTLPGCALWAWAWWGGWNNSFHKGYEQAAVGPLFGLLGTALFIGAMLYVPLGLARQAVTGIWRSFYEFGVVRRVIATRWAACTGLAALYALLAVPVNVMKTAPVGFDRIEGYARLTDAEVLANLNNYFWLACFAVFPMYLLLRVVAARIYAGGLLAALRRGWLTADRLAESERAALERLELLPVEPVAPPSLPGRAARGSGRLVLTAIAIVLLVAIWFGFVAEIFVTEFINYHGPRGWLNQPLVQLPWFRYIPPHLTGG